jgi:hypothetical protein
MVAEMVWLLENREKNREKNGVKRWRITIDISNEIK